MIQNYLIQVIPQGNKFLAKVLKETGIEQREKTYECIGVALSDFADDAIYNAVQEAFFS
jgi:hypothetical protein